MTFAGCRRWRHWPACSWQDWIRSLEDSITAAPDILPRLLLRADGQLELLSEGGPLLGVVPAATFDQGSVQLRAGELLLICSDGILESFNDADQEFGRERLEAELRSARNGSADAVLFSVLGAVQDFAAPRPLTDDMTLVVVNH